MVALLRVILFLFPALCLAAEGADLRGRIIELRRAQNARTNDRDFRGAYRSNVKYVLQTGAQAKVEKTKTLASGSTALYVQLLSDPHRGERVWVYWHKEPSRRTLKLVDESGKATEEPPRAAQAIAKQETAATSALQAEVPERVESVVAKTTPVQAPAPLVSGRSPILTLSAPAITRSSDTVPHVTIPIPAHDSAPPLPANLCGSMGTACLTKDAAQFLKPTTQAQSEDPEIKALAAKIVREAGAGDDPVKISRAIHNWVAENIPYDYEAWRLYQLNPNNLIGYAVDAKTALARGTTGQRTGTICSGYSNLVTALSRAAGIPAVTIEGVVRYETGPPSLTGPLVCGKSQIHAWNLVWLNGRWQPQDVTWDSNPFDENGVGSVRHYYGLGGQSWAAQSPDHLQCQATPMALGTLPAVSVYASSAQPAASTSAY